VVPWFVWTGQWAQISVAKKAGSGVSTPVCLRLLASDKGGLEAPMLQSKQKKQSTVTNKESNVLQQFRTARSKRPDTPYTRCNKNKRRSDFKAGQLQACVHRYNTLHTSWGTGGLKPLSALACKPSGSWEIKHRGMSVLTFHVVPPLSQLDYIVLVLAPGLFFPSCTFLLVLSKSGCYKHQLKEEVNTN
jgi:hypothetical protein